jgi:Family of unknown function (DUF6368)
MAGPVILIYTKKIDENTQLNLAKMLKNSLSIDEVNDSNDSYDVHFKKGKFAGINLKENSCTFLLNIEEKKYLDQIQQQDIFNKLQLENPTEINLSAMCNQPIDHLLLATLAIEIQKITGGFIDINGRICPQGYPKLSKHLALIYPSDEVIRNYVQEIKGGIYEIYHEIDDYSATSYSHVVDVKWLENWIQHPDFHLIK